MEISKISVNGTNYDIVDTVTSINGKTGAISASDINAVLSDGGYDISGSAGYTAGTGISISELNAISVTYGNTSGTACQGNDSRLSDSRPASDVSAWAKAETKPTYSYSEITNTPSSLPASDVSSWAKANSKPSYNLDEVTDGTSRKIPTKVSELTNDSGYLTSHQSLSGYATESWVGQQGYLTSHQSLSGYATESWVSSKFNDVLGIDASGVSDLVSILSDNDTATGILNVIASKANASSIPTKVSDLTNDTGFITSYTNTVTSINGKTGEIAAADMAAVLTAAGYALTDTNTWPTALSQLSNDVGYITGITSSMVTTALGYTPATTDTNTWRPITNTYTGSDEGTSLSLYGANALYNDLVNGYASSAGNADTLDGYHYNGLPYLPTSYSDGATLSVTGDGSYLRMLRILSPNLSAGYQNDFQVGVSDTAYNVAQLGLYYAGDGSQNNYLYLGLHSVDNQFIINGYGRIGIGTTSPSYKLDVNGDANATTLYENGYRVITSANIGSQSVNYATSAGSAPASDVYSWAKASSKPSYSASEVGALPLGGFSSATSGIAGWGTLTSGNGYGGLYDLEESGGGSLTVAQKSGLISMQLDGYFYQNEGAYRVLDTSDTGGYSIVTAANIGSQSVNYANSAGSVAWSNVSSRPTALSSFTNDSGYITSSGSCNYATSAGSASSATLATYFQANSFSNENDAVPSNSQFAGYLGTTSATGSDGFVLAAAWNSGSYAAQLFFDTDPTHNLSIRQRGNDGNWNSWKYIVTEANIGSQSVNYANSAGYASSAGSAPASDVYSWAKLSSKPSYSYSEISGRPTKLSDLTNDVGYITSYTDTNTWRPITDTYTGSDTGTSVSQAGTNALYNALVNGYASSAGTASNLSGFENNNNSGKNADDVTYNAHTYYTSNGPSTSLGASVDDGALYSQAYSNNWVALIAQDYRNGRLFVRGKNNGSWQSWKRIANYDEIPTNTNQLTNGAGFITSSGSCSYASSAGSAPASDVYSWAKASTKPSYSYSEISGTPGSLPASDVYSWAKASSKPSYAYSEIGYSAYTATTSGALTLDGSTYPLCCITLNGNISSVAFSSYPPAGHSCHIMFNNTSSSDYTVAIAHGTLKCPEGQDISLTVKAGGYAEIDVLHVANVAYFVRGV